MRNKIDLSIIIPSYNTKDILNECIHRVVDSFHNEKTSYEIIIVDNGSTDGSIELFKKNWSTLDQFRIIENKKNVGFGAANNIGLQKAQGEFILFLNSDAFIKKVQWKELIEEMRDDKKIGVIGIKVILPDGKDDMASHRGFPTVWRSFCYYSKLESLSKKISFLRPMFGGYHLLEKNWDTVHEIDSPTGAFYLTRKDLMETLKGFDLDYFMYGEDLDLSYRIKNLGFSIVYDPRHTVIHLKNQSGMKKNNTKIKSKTRSYFFESMKIFYDKHYASHHSSLFNKIIHSFIDLKSKSS